MDKNSSSEKHHIISKNNNFISSKHKETELPKNPLPQPKDYEEIEY